MEHRSYEQSSHLERHYHEPVTPHSSPASTVLSVFLGLVVCFLLVVGAIKAFNQVAIAGVIVAFSTIVIACLAMLALIGGLIWHKFHMANINKKHAEADLEAKNNQVSTEKQIAEAEAKRIEAEAQYILAEAEKLVSTIEWDEQGNAARFDPLTRQVIQLQGNMRQFPSLSSLHYSIKQEGKDVPALPPAAGGIVKPTIEEIVSQLTRNSYEFCLGRSLQSGEYIKAQLLDAHVKLIGGTRMGKSCEAAAILKELSQTHDRQHLLFALLDLENKTSRLFADDPHIMVVDTGMKKVKMHARTIEQVAHYLIMLHDMMNWRYSLTDAQLTVLPAVVIYLEEFLYWKRQLANFVGKDVREQALMAFSGIATRGLKAKVHLMCCAQVDYRDDDLIEAMAQFIGVNVAFSVKPDAARAAGFVSSELLKQNYAARIPGQFVVEQTGGADIGVAPEFDVRAQLALLEEGQTVITEEPATRLQPYYNPTRNKTEFALQAKVQQIMENSGETMAETIKRVWKVSPSGNSPKYESAKAEYMQCQEYIHAMAKQSMKEEGA